MEVQIDPTHPASFLMDGAEPLGQKTVEIKQMCPGPMVDGYLFLGVCVSLFGPHLSVAARWK